MGSALPATFLCEDHLKHFGHWVGTYLAGLEPEEVQAATAKLAKAFRIEMTMLKIPQTQGGN